MIKKLIPLVIIMVLIIVACNGGTQETASNDSEVIAQVATDIPVIEASDEPIAEQPTEVMQATVEEVAPTQIPTIVPTAIPATIAPTAVPETASYNAPDWTNLQLVNAHTGVAFTLADFAGKTVFVEPMATWCSNCRAQQGTIAQVITQLDADDFVFISLSVGENVSNDVLADYATRNNFPQVFAVASENITRALIDTFGFSATSPPSTPHFTISPIGTVSSLSTGLKNVDAFVQEALAVQGS